ncbi:DUF2953 domain-containing protein [Dethiobacter alkaliphilus]|uniref:DUF2953 domain-containing protein n=1 Tax=Dethiobacter alkaliphilus TaxID=427926 RepID=UPI002227B88D|nr:DUF2953 domain-containing protein [Dethiobacter alkaliphilus]MCW3491460.1 DUF2953 domain-containing protein [Dethiobacter alkaliphilus]
MEFVLSLYPFYIVTMLLLLLVPVRINLFFVRENKDDFLTIRVNTLFSLIRFNIEVPILQQETPLDLTLEAELKAGQDKLVREEKEKLSALEIHREKLQIFLDYLQKNKQILSFMARFYTRALTVEKLVLRVRAGVDDAALTAQLCGLYWAVTGTLKQFVQKRLNFTGEPVFTIDPDFSSQPVFAVKLDTVIALRIGHFTVMGPLLLWTIIRGGRKKDE